MAKADPAQLARSATAASKLLKALANRNRLLILCQLSGGEVRVSDLGRRLKLSPSALSQHLAGLKNQRIVDVRRDSRSMYYRLAKGPAQRLMKTLVAIYCSPSASGSRASGRRPRRPPASEPQGSRLTTAP